MLDRWGTIIKAEDPTTDWTRPDYEAAPWAPSEGKGQPERDMERIELGDATLY